MSEKKQPTSSPVTRMIPAVDGYPLQAQLWIHNGSAAVPMVIINPATSVLARYYSRFAAFLHGHGFNVMTYDYRGIGGSRPQKMREFDAGWLDWGCRDFEGVLRFTEQYFAGHPLYLVGHSVGGFLLGMAPSNIRIRRVFMMGAQFAHWRDYMQSRRFAMFVRWHLFMPALTAVYGYFPGKRLGWLEDTPRGVVRDWVASPACFEEAYRKGPHAISDAERAELVDSFAAVTAEILSLSVADDEFGTTAAIGRLLAYYKCSHRVHLHIDPLAAGLKEIGHFAFFNQRFEHTLWQIALVWLRDGRVMDYVGSERLKLPRDPLCR